LNWEEDDLGTITELKDLETLLRDSFNFTTEIWRIPTTRAEDKLESKISLVKAEHGGENKLLIVYYGGHGRFDPNGRSIWHALVLVLCLVKNGVDGLQFLMIGNIQTN
jgi:hypothetical protein